jgi:hypothetical protein
MIDDSDLDGVLLCLNKIIWKVPENLVSTILAEVSDLVEDGHFELQGDEVVFIAEDAY